LRLFWLTAWSRALPEKLTGSQLVKEFPAFYGTRRSVTASVRVCHLSFPSQINQVHIPQPTSWRSILILSSLHA
jgi:hypothetical protein